MERRFRATRRIPPNKRLVARRWIPGGIAAEGVLHYLNLLWYVHVPYEDRLAVGFLATERNHRVGGLHGNDRVLG